MERDRRVGESLALQHQQALKGQGGHALGADRLLFPHEIGDLRQEPGIDHGFPADALERPAGAERVGDVTDAVAGVYCARKRTQVEADHGLYQPVLCFGNHGFRSSCHMPALIIATQ